MAGLPFVARFQRVPEFGPNNAVGFISVHPRNKPGVQRDPRQIEFVVTLWIPVQTSTPPACTKVLWCQASEYDAASIAEGGAHQLEYILQPGWIAAVEQVWRKHEVERQVVVRIARQSARHVFKFDNRDIRFIRTVEAIRHRVAVLIYQANILSLPPSARQFEIKAITPFAQCAGKGQFAGYLEQASTRRTGIRSSR